MKIGKQLSIACAFLCSTASAELLASTDSPSPAKTSFAYSISHTVKPLPAHVIEKITEPSGDALSADDFDLTEPAPKPVDVRVGPPRHPSRNLVCSAAASVAQANNLPIPFFANLIWHESSFDTRTISRAGAQGIAQFMPRTAVQFGLINPFEPIHALNAAGKFVRDLNAQFGNYGLAAAAYNAGPRRVSDWLAKKGELPGETRNYVVRITGRPVEEWIGAKNDVEMLTMPAKAPCVEVAQAVEAHAKTLRMARLIAELATTASQTRDKKDDGKPDAEAAASDTTERGWIVRATLVVRDVLKRMEERKIATRLAATKAEAIKAEARAARAAARNAGKDDEQRSRTSRRAEVIGVAPPVKNDTPPAIAKGTQRAALRVASNADAHGASKPDAKGTPTTDGAASRAEAKHEPPKPGTAASETGKSEAEAAKPEEAKPAARRRIQRVARYTYSDMLRPH